MAPNSNWSRAIIHIDGDSFFASCEQAIHPEYRGKPVITGKERGIVAAASYEAKALGINRGTALWDVKKICPEAIIVPSDYETYSLFSERMFAIMRRFTNEIEEYGIDEGFADITGLDAPYGASIEEIVRTIKETIERDLEISVSLGLSTTKVLAKLGSRYDKPSGCTIIPLGGSAPFLSNTPVGKVWGIGWRTTPYCNKLGIHTALDFAEQTQDEVERRYTKPFIELWHELNGRAVLSLETAPKTSYDSISKTRTFTPPSNERTYVFAQLLKNVENACIKVRRYHLATQHLVVYLKEQSFHVEAVEISLTRPSCYPQEMLAAVREAFDELFDPRVLYRATGVVLPQLVPQHTIQLSLFESPLALDRLERVYHSVDMLSERFGKHTVHLGGSHTAHLIPQHVRDRGDLTERKQHRLKGESRRKHLTIPLLTNQV